MIRRFHSNNDALLAHLGLATLDAVRAYEPDDLVKNHNHGARDIVRLRAALPGQPTTLFLKRIWRAARKDGLKSLFLHRQLRSVSMQEWLNYESLQKAGIPTPPLIAYGQETGTLWEHFSFILTAPAPGVPLDDFLRATPLSSPVRRPTLKHLARFVRQLHQAGLFSPDLFARHIFVDVSDPGGPNFTLIDMARLDHASPRNPRLRARDLAALNITAPLSVVTRTERFRFLRDYDRAALLLLPRIRRRHAHLIRRPKYAPFYQ